MAAKTLQEKLIAAQALVVTLTAAIEADTKFSNLEKGGLVGFSFGRGENKKNEAGVVEATGKLDNGVEVVVVIVGQGINATLKRVPLSTVNAYTPPVKADVPVDVAPADTVEQTATNPEVGSVDDILSAAAV